jgi:hypothetical protein
VHAGVELVECLGRCCAWISGPELSTLVRPVRWANYCVGDTSTGLLIQAGSGKSVAFLDDFLLITCLGLRQGRRRPGDVRLPGFAGVDSS